MRIFLWLAASIFLGVIIHLVVILSMPALAPNTTWSRIARLDALEKMLVLNDIEPLKPNPLQLDPELIYAVCRLSLSNGPGVIRGELAGDFWSVGVFDASGRAVYGTTNRSANGQKLQLGIFNQAQTRLLAQQKLDISEGLLVVESKLDDIFIVLRMAPAFAQLRPRYKEQLAKISCANA
ncbi:hypothetical protein MNBD_ALPHA12-231 [hydrothermal vent metagenome]|uniref:DUF1254 domain-containing protein n=1 Tax=hydrothermal vent metagenome TaxID=652676 RepID=A0A3B0UDV9_9ZZZZ